MTRFVFFRNTHQEESHIASQTAAGPGAHCRRQSVARPRTINHRPTLPSPPNFVPLQLEPSTCLGRSRGRQAGGERHQVEPFVYPGDILRRLPDHPINKIAELLPQNLRTPNS